ncbi:MAG TPA: hypothetical protein PLM75_11150, partial [bacterium]|nr:hypothetical protein [bacterium]
YWTQQNQNFIEAKPGDKITVKYQEFEDFTYLAQYQSPTRIKTIMVYQDQNYSINYIGKPVPRETTLYLEVRSDDFGNNILRDTTIVTLNANHSNDTIYVTLTEISPTAGVYRGIAYLGIQSSGTTKTLGVNYGDTVYISSAILEDTRAEISLVVVANANPTFLNSIKFMNSSYTDLLKNATNSRVLQNEKIYIELNGTDANPDLLDYTTLGFVTFYTIPLQHYNSFSDAQLADSAFYTSSTFLSKINGRISISLYETAKNTGKYRNWLQLSNVSDTYQQLLKHSPGDIILAVVMDRNNLVFSDTAFVAVIEEPSYLSFLNFKVNFNGNPAELQNRDIYVDFGETLYIQAFGDVAGFLLADTTLVYLIKTNRFGQTDSVPVILYETNKTSGFYQGVARLSTTNFQPTVRDVAPPILNIDRGDTIVVKWSKNPNICDTVYVIQPQPKSPKIIELINFYRDNNYSDIILNKFDRYGDIYIEVIEGDTTNVNAQSSNTDIDTVIIQAYNGIDTIHILCVETSRSSKIYRGKMSLGYSTNETLKILESDFGRNIYFTPYVAAGYSYFLKVPVLNTPPSSRWREVVGFVNPLSITSIKFMNSSYTQPQPLSFSPTQGDKVYFELNGEDANTMLADKVWIVQVSVYRSD